MGLFDDLSRMSNNISPTQEAAPHETAQQPIEPAPVGGGDIMSQLQRIGDQAGVNPPMPEGGVPVVETPPEKQKPTGSASSGPGTCPHCEKEFKKLGAHKCKVQAKKEMQASIQGGTTAGVPSDGGTVEVNAEGQPEYRTGAVVASCSQHGEITEDFINEVTGTAPVQTRDVPEPGSEYVGEYIVLLGTMALKDTEGDIHQFSEIIGPLCDEVAKENGVPYWSTIDFGKSNGLLAVKMDRWLRANKPEGFIVAEGHSPEINAVKSVLTRYAANVVVSAG